MSRIKDSHVANFFKQKKVYRMRVDSEPGKFAIRDKSFQHLFLKIDSKKRKRFCILPFRHMATSILLLNYFSSLNVANLQDEILHLKIISRNKAAALKIFNNLSL